MTTADRIAQLEAELSDAQRISEQRAKQIREHNHPFAKQLDETWVLLGLLAQTVGVGENETLADATARVVRERDAALALNAKLVEALKDANNHLIKIQAALDAAGKGVGK